MQVFKNRVGELESFAFRTNSALQALALDLGKVKSMVTKKLRSDKTIETRLSAIESQQALLAESQAHMTSQLNSIERLLQQLVSSQVGKNGVQS